MKRKAHTPQASKTAGFSNSLRVLLSCRSLSFLSLSLSLAISRAPKDVLYNILIHLDGLYVIYFYNPLFLLYFSFLLPLYTWKIFWLCIVMLCVYNLKVFAHRWTIIFWVHLVYTYWRSSRNDLSRVRTV